MPCHSFLGCFQSSLWAFVPAPLIYGAENSPMGPTEPPHYSSTNQCFKKPPSSPPFKKLLSSDHFWWQQPLMFHCFLDTGAACPEPAAGNEQARIQMPRVQDNAHPRAIIACFFQHFLAGTVPWTQRGWFIPRFNRQNCLLGALLQKTVILLLIHKILKVPKEMLLDYGIQKLKIKLFAIAAKSCMEQGVQNPNISL